MIPFLVREKRKHIMYWLQYDTLWCQKKNEEMRKNKSPEPEFF
jgi:hypothetical protein